MRFKIGGPQINMQSITRTFLAVFLLSVSSIGQAQEEITRHIIELSPGIGYHQFDTRLNLEDGSFGSIGLGIHFSRQWALILHYSNFFTTLKDSSAKKDIHAQKYHVDVHYSVRTKHRLRPYILGGFGQIDLDNYGGEKVSDTQINIGMGLYYRMTPRWSVRGDLRTFDYINDRLYDDTATITLGYRFGGGERGN